MQLNTAKQKLLAGQPAYGYSLGLGSPLVAELLARSGIDFLLLETQHGSWGHDGAIAALMGITGGSAIPMTRVAKNEYFLIGKLLDQGCWGWWCRWSIRRSRPAAADACASARGNRSWGVGRARVYGDDYGDWIDEQLFVAVQLESATAVDNAEAIMATPGVDGWAGPADLALSMGIHPRDMAGDERHARALERIVTACRNTGKAPRLACNSRRTPEARGAGLPLPHRRERRRVPDGRGRGGGQDPGPEPGPRPGPPDAGPGGSGVCQGGGVDATGAGGGGQVVQGLLVEGHALAVVARRLELQLARGVVRSVSGAFRAPRSWRTAPSTRALKRATSSNAATLMASRKWPSWPGRGRPPCCPARCRTRRRSIEERRPISRARAVPLKPPMGSRRPSRARRGRWWGARPVEGPSGAPPFWR